MRSIKRSCPGVHCLFSQEADPQPHISKDATEKLVAQTAAGSRSGIDGYELHGHLSEQLFRAIGDYFANFSSSVGSISEETYSRQAVYFSYTSVHYDEELFVGYRHFDKRDIEPLFPFGHGLSYTMFEYGDLMLEQDDLTETDTLVASLTVTNTGDCAGAEVVQLYVADLDAPHDRPLQALQGFARLHLAPGEKQSVPVEIPAEQLRNYCPDSNTSILRSGRYEIRVGSSSRDIRARSTFHIYDNNKTAVEAS